MKLFILAQFMHIIRHIHFMYERRMSLKGWLQ